LFYFIAASCNKDPVTLSIDAGGTIQRTGNMTYQYGSHVLKDSKGKTTYALKSETVNLDSYVGKNISKIYGNKVKGYPVDGGPEYIDVVLIK
jgi:hypothetical protein